MATPRDLLNDAKAHIREVEPAEVVDLVGTVTFLDVREPDEWSQLHIPGAHLIPKDTLLNQIQDLSIPLSQNIYIHCHSGVRSLLAGNWLISQGYTSVHSVSGGIVEWAKEGYPTQSAKSSLD